MPQKKAIPKQVLLALLTVLLSLLRPSPCAEVGFGVSDASSPPVGTLQSEEDSHSAPTDSEIHLHALPSQPSAMTTLFTNSHEQSLMAAGDLLVYSFTPAWNDSYIFRSFPIADAIPPNVSIRLLRQSDKAILYEGEQSNGFRIECELTAEENYALEITALSAGEMAVEVMMNARGRCFDNPITLPSESVRYAKTIVRPRDAHWFRFTAPLSGRYLIRTEKTGGDILDTMGYLLDSGGNVLEVSDDILFPGDSNFLIEQDLTAGETYYVRISALSNLTGAYRLVLTVPQDTQILPASVSLSRHDLMMDVDEEYRLSTSIYPTGAESEIIYSSSNTDVVSVEPDGTLRALSAGEAIIWAISYEGVNDRCRVTVRPVEVTGMTFAQDEVSLRVDEQLTLQPIFTPANASDQTAQYRSSNESIVTVSQDGVLTGISRGRAVITATSSDGSFADTVNVSVEGIRPIYRALVVGEQSYEGDTRLGGRNTAQGVADMLNTQSMDGSGYEVRLQLDSTRQELISGIQDTFGSAGENDISLLYINCHGAYENGVAYIRLHDESRVTVRQLEAALRNISGKIVVILDFCQSGAFIGAGEDFERFSSQTHSAFAATALTSGRYTVITSASSAQDSYRRSFTGSGGESGTAAIMGRSLCEGAGWDLIYDRSVSLKADADRNKQITVQEIYEYTRRRVMHYLENTGVVQTVHIYPEGDQTVILGRN